MGAAQVKKERDSEDIPLSWISHNSGSGEPRGVSTLICRLAGNTKTDGQMGNREL